MKVFVQFDATVGPYDIQSQLYTFRSMNGVKNVELLCRKEGEGPRYCLEIEADDAVLNDLTRQAESVRSQFAGYINNMKLSAFSKA